MFDRQRKKEREIFFDRERELKRGCWVKKSFPRSKTHFFSHKIPLKKKERDRALHI